MPLCVNTLIYTYCLWVGQRPEPVVVLLSCCIPQAQVHWFPINHHIGRVVVKPVEFIKYDRHLRHRTDGLTTSPFADHFHDTAIFEQRVCVCYLHGGDVLSREGIGSVADEQACFTHSPEIRMEIF